MKKKKLHLLGADSAISSERVGRFKFSPDLESDEEDQARTKIFALLVFIIVCALLLRLFYLQVVAGSQNRVLADNNRIRLVGIVAPRGKIFDRNGQVLASSSRIFWLENEEDKKQINSGQKEDLEAQGLASENYAGSLGQIYEEVVREYTLGEAAAHVLGYISRVQKEDLAKNSNLGLQDLVGRAGIEETYGDFLAGTSGKKLVEVDASGKKVAILDEVPAKEGTSVHLTIDARLQKVAYEALRKGAQKVGTNRGAIIVASPLTGEVLALASLPSFDPNNVGSVTNDPQRPLFNRAVLGNYPPGSIFKIVSALAGLESGKITAETEIEDVGEFYLGDVRFSNWYFTIYGRKDGVLKIERAIARSNDIFFYRLAGETGLEAVRKMAIALGFGQRTGIDLPSEDFGLVPDETWKKSTFNLPWFGGDTLHLSIGQGFMLATPMQISSLVNFMASGELTRPYLVRQIDSPKISKINPKVIGKNLVSDANFKLVREGMRQACQSGGTGWPFFGAAYTVGCKTGTAEKAQGNPHAWFSAFAPFEGPQISVTVLVEDGGEGSTVAGPIAREVLDWWFGQH